MNITFRNAESSQAVIEAVEKRYAHLLEHFPKIDSCDVVITAPSQHHNHGTVFGCRLDLHVPGKHIVVTKSHDDWTSHEDVYVAIRDAFSAAAKQLETHFRS